MSRRVLAASIALDAALGDPGGAWHPVAGAGRLLEAAHRPLGRSSPRRQLAGGVAALAGCAALAAVFSRAAERLGCGRFWPLQALALKQTFSVRQLLAEAQGVDRALVAGDLVRARALLRGLVSRPTEELPAALVASAAIESLAENLADSVAAPWFYYALFGIPGAAVYRVVNTADAMFGYHGQLEWLGKPAARADDLLSWLPSRLAAACLVLAAALTGGRASARRALAAWLAEGSTTASPNAGRPMAAMAGGLGRRLHKPGHYVLGRSYRQPDETDIRRAQELVMVATGVLSVTALAVLSLRRR